MIGIIGFLIGWFGTLFILIYFDKDERWYRKIQKMKFEFKDYHRYELNVGNKTHYLKWDGEKLEIKGDFKGREYEG